MAYSKGYQTVIAGMVREDELGFFRNNMVATPAGCFGIHNKSGKVQPKIDVEALHDEGMGKKPAGVVNAFGEDKVRKPLKSAYNPSSHGVGM